MKLKRFRYLIALLAALVSFQSVMAAARICTMPLTVQSQLGLPMLEAEGHGDFDPCSVGGDLTCLSRLSPVSGNDLQALLSVATVASVLPPQMLYHVDFPSVPARLNIATSSSRTPPSPTLLFGNLRL